jgi:ataxia telangiectasia mutated family protein
MRENKTAKELTLDRRIRLLQNQVRVEDSARALTQQQHNDALTGCLTAYGECLAAGDSHDTAALFRLVALWYKSAHVPQINTLMGTILAAQRGGGARMLPSAKFLALAWQLVARLEPDDAFTTGFQPVLHALVGRVVRDHPYHSLYQLLALRAADVVGQAQLVNAPKAKVAAAKAVLDSVRASSPRLADIIAQMEVMAGAYTTIALLELTAEQKKASLATLTLPAEVVRMAGLPLVPIATTHLEVDPTCAYARGSFPAFTKFESSASLVGGVNKPRKIRAVGSDGRRYTQLAKGQDDLRQDAVMQQVFGHASALLRGAPGARARSLRMHTYRVVPFNPLAGVVEWAEDTVPLSEWLISGTASAHRRLRPEDMSNSEARDVMDAAHKLGRANLRKPFDDVCDQFHPVLHHFFLESFPTAPLWYERRLAYTRSVAVSSMVGYIIGLGDRHSSNILIGRTSAELVHIDLGVAFDQGKLLNTPETVPFRLTRDIVDGCGAAGVEGVMRRCCEETLTVLRANKESLQTLVEVLIHDPILKWAMTPEQARKRQQEPAEERDVFALEEPGESRMRATATATADTFAPGAAGVQNADAERALLRVRQKLDGIEEGEPRSVEGQVQQLIQDARDPDKLCRLFPGWAPWV